MRARQCPDVDSSRALLLFALLAACASAALGCDSEVGEVAFALFELQTGKTQDLFALPYPNDLRVKADGTLDLARLATDWSGSGSTTKDLVQLYLDEVARNRFQGFGLNAAAYFRFSGPIDTACLPASAEDSLQAGAQVFLVNIDKRSSGYNGRVPVKVRFRTDARGTVIGAHNLSVMPVFGFPLEEGALHAVILTDGLCDPNGDPVQPAAAFTAAIGSSPPSDKEQARAHAIYSPLRDYLKDQALTGVISAAVFTTCKATHLAGRARQVIHRLAAPTAASLEIYSESSRYSELRGTYQAPNFQAGTPPFSQPAQGGEIKVDSKGDPVVARSETLRFALSVPAGTMPAAGWPVVLYAHGTGGSYRTFIKNGVASALSGVTDESGTVVARMAVVGIDQNMHYPRVPTNAPEVLFFNFLNPAAAVHNVVQAGIDDFSLLRMVQGLRITSAAWTKSSGKSGSLTFSPPIKLDPQRIYFMGHSQGGLTGPVFLAYEPGVKAAVLSGAGGGAISSLLEKTEPVDIRALVELALGESSLDELHPLLNLMQQMLEPADTSNYGRRLIYHLASGVGPKHVYLSEGIKDSYTPNVTTESLALAIGLPQVAPVERKISTLALAGLAETVSPLAGNLLAGSTKVTGGLLQYKASAGSDGHFVVFDNSRAMRQYARFLATMARDGVAAIVP